MKIDFRPEWACTSKYARTLCLSFFWRSFTSCLRKNGSGVSFWFGLPNNLLTSLPMYEHRVLPIDTPSALIIGIILKITRFLKASATLSLLSKNLIIPCTIQEAWLSPGCTLPVITMTFFLWASSLVWLKSVIVNIGTSSPPKDVVKLVVSTILNEFALIVGSWYSASLYLRWNSFRT